MSDSSSDEQDEGHILYKDRPEWKDITPVPQDDGDGDVVTVDYSAMFKDAFDYFRAVVQKKEYSERALELTESCAEINPANYTVWQFRREILKALDKDLQKELDLVEKFILKHLKNYQIWHHRRLLVEWLKDPAKEKYLTEKVLQNDAKNYHAWQHRQWVIKTYNLFDGELDYVDSLLEQDMRNNSAWNQRFFVITNTTGFTEAVLDREFQYTMESIRTITENESAWNYLRGLLLNDQDGLSKNGKVAKFCEELYTDGIRSPFLLGLIVDMCSEEASMGSGDNLYNAERAKELCHALATEYDPIRANYWVHMSNNIDVKSAGEVEGEEPGTS